jgi:hypothetical protein
MTSRWCRFLWCSLPVMLFILATMLDNLLEKFIFIVVILACFAYMVWYHVLE